jgi:hypothetical protein
MDTDTMITLAAFVCIVFAALVVAFIHSACDAS